jgi:hypothetical protein
MPVNCLNEMLADWEAAGKAKGRGNDLVEWYLTNRSRMTLHPRTRAFIEVELNTSAHSLETYLRACPTCKRIFADNVATVIDGENLTDEQLPALIEYFSNIHLAH